MSPLISDRVVELASHTLPPQIRNHREKIAKKMITAALEGLLEATNTLRLMAQLMQVVQEKEARVSFHYKFGRGWLVEIGYPNNNDLVYSNADHSELDGVLRQILEPFNKEIDD